MKRQLPVILILIASIDLCRKHAAYALRIIGPWFLILAIGPCLLFGLSSPTSLQLGELEEPWSSIFFLLTIVAWGSIAVLWHWRILRDDSLSQRFVIFDKRVWLYALKFVLISIVIVGASMLLVLTLSSAAAQLVTSVFGSLGTIVMFFGAILTAFFLGARLFVALPAVALKTPNFGFRDAWRVTDGNGVRMFFATWLPFVPLLLLWVKVETNGVPVFGFPHWSAPFVLKHLIHEFVEFSSGLLSLTVLSLCYAFFVEIKDSASQQQT
jgi:hypothetical protein